MDEVSQVVIFHLLSLCYAVQGCKMGGRRTQVLLGCFPCCFILPIDYQVVYLLNEFQEGSLFGGFSVLPLIKRYEFLEVSKRFKTLADFRLTLYKNI